MSIRFGPALVVAIVAMAVVASACSGRDQPRLATPPASQAQQGGGPAGPEFGPFTLADLGIKLAYARVDSSGMGSLVVHSVDDSTVDVRGTRGIYTGIAWSPDGQKLALSFGSSPASQDIFTVQADGTNLRQLTRDGQSRRPTWAPEGDRLAFTRGPSADRLGAIFTITADGASPTQLSKQATYDDPSWAPDGSAIAVSAGPGVIALLSPKTGEELRRIFLLRDANPISTPITWTSDAKAAAAVIARGSGLAAIALSDDMTTQRQVGGAFLGTPGDPGAAHPSITPDGSKVVVASNDDGNIYVMDILAGPTDVPTPPPAIVTVLVSPPRNGRLTFPAVSPVIRPTGGNPNT